jgi:predicted transcriptional regulator
MTYARAAELLGCSVKAVERYLAPEGAASFQSLPAYRLELMELRMEKEGATR